MPEDSERQAFEDALFDRRLEQLNLKFVDPLPTDRNIIELYLMIVACVLAISFFIHPPVLSVHIDNAWRYAWRTLLIVGSIAVSTGLLWTGRPLTAYGVRKIGYIALGFGALAYGVADQDWMTFGFGLAAFIRAVQLDIAVAKAYPGHNILGAPLRWIRGHPDG